MRRILLFLYIHCTFLFKLYTCILGGSEVQVDAVPYQVALFDGNTFICSGSLISEQWILTAAKCVKGVYSLRVKLGATNIAQNEGFAAEEEIKSVIIHPEYADTIQNNIALIEIKRPVTFTHTIASIAVGNNIDLDGKLVYLSGWGKTGMLYPKSNVLCQVSLSVMSNSDCSSAYLIFFKTITAKDMCTHGNLLRGRSRCHTDIGAPLVLKEEENVQVGIVSAAPPLCTGSMPTIYVKVSMYKKWIDGHIGKLEGSSMEKAEGNPEGSPTEEPGEERPTEEFGENRPIEGSGEERPTKEHREKRRVEELGEEKLTEESGEERPTEESGEERPTEESGEERHTEKSREERPTEKSGEERHSEDSEEEKVRGGTRNETKVVEEIRSENEKENMEEKKQGDSSESSGISLDSSKIDKSLEHPRYSNYIIKLF